MDFSRTWGPGPWGCAGPGPWWRPREAWQRPGSTEVDGRVREEEERELQRARSERAGPSGESIGRRRERQGQREERQRDTESPKGWPGTGASGEEARGRARAEGASAQSRAAGGGRAAVLLLILRGFALSESAFGDTGTKAVHHITARPGGSLRSRRLIRGERVGRRGGREADCQAGARAPRSDPRRGEGAGLRARLWGDSGRGGRTRYVERC